MDELVEWYGQQLDTDERIARACPGDGKWTPADIAFYGNDLSPEVRAHMAEHDPARALREIDAKRQVISRFVHWASTMSSVPDQRDIGVVEGLEMALRLLATAYADRPGFKESWRP